MTPRPDYRPSAYDDDWEDTPASGAYPKWFGGIIVPLLLVGYGVACFITGRGVLWGDGIPMSVTGTKAVALGVACASLGVFIHCHYFWGSIYEESAWAVLGKIVSMVGFIGGLGYLIVRTFLG